jgi:hypothetical protein
VTASLHGGVLDIRPIFDQDLALDSAKALYWRGPIDHALIVQGETYRPNGDVDVIRSGPRWISISCAGTSIAKMRLLGLDPMADSSAEGRGARQATLKMLTATYKAGVTHETVKGMPLRWVARDGTEYVGGPDKATWGPLEARWTRDGAVCLNHLRRMRKSDKQSLEELSAEEAHELQQLNLPRCQTRGKMPRTRFLWETYTIDHIEHRGTDLAAARR